MEPDEKKPDDNIWIETLVSHKTGEPIVVLRWYDHSGQLTPAEARLHALHILEAADAAESDAFLLDFCRKKIGMELEQSAKMLIAFREYRDEQEEKSHGS